MATQALIRAINDYIDADVVLEWRRRAGVDASQLVQRMERLRRRMQHQLSEAQPSDASLVQAAETYLNAHLAERMAEGERPDSSTIQRARRELMLRLVPTHPEHRSAGETRPVPLTSRILLAIDDSQPSQWATDVAGGLAQALDARVMVVHIVEITEREDTFGFDELVEQRRRDGAALLDRAMRALPAAVESDQMLRDGIPSEEIVSAARTWEADQIIMGTRGRGRLATFVLGSTAEAVVRQAPCPVLTVGHQPERFVGHARRSGAETVLR
jgi:nucleotide-binding universal stress UspA family protein